MVVCHLNMVSSVILLIPTRRVIPPLFSDRTPHFCFFDLQGGDTFLTQSPSWQPFESNWDILPEIYTHGRVKECDTNSRPNATGRWERANDAGKSQHKSLKPIPCRGQTLPARSVDGRVLFPFMDFNQKKNSGKQLWEWGAFSRLNLESAIIKSRDKRRSAPANEIQFPSFQEAAFISPLHSLDSTPAAFLAFALFTRACVSRSESGFLSSLVSWMLSRIVRKT